MSGSEIKSAESTGDKVLTTTQNLARSYIVKLLSDKEGGSQSAREKHIDEVIKLCDRRNREDPTNGPYRKVEARLQYVFPGYIGSFDETMVAAIARLPMYKRHDRNVAAEPCGAKTIARRSWGPARMTYPESEFYSSAENFPKDADTSLEYGNKIPKGSLWKHNVDENMGQDCTIYVLDADFVDTDFKMNPNRLTARKIFGDNSPLTSGHGTIVASCAAGDLMGVAPRAKVYVAFGSKAVSAVDIVWGLELITLHDFTTVGSDISKAPPAVLNLSFIIRDEFPPLEDGVLVLAQRGVLLVTGSGNDGVNFQNSPGQKAPTVPQAYKEMIVVGAVDQYNRRCAFSNYDPGLKYVHTWAPGFSLRLAGTREINHGTSFASPHVAGFLASLMSKEYGATPRTFSRTKWTTTYAKEELQKYCITSEDKQVKPLRTLAVAKDDKSKLPESLRWTTLTIMKPEPTKDVFSVNLPIIGRPYDISKDQLVKFGRALRANIYPNGNFNIDADVSACNEIFRETFPMEEIDFSCKACFRSTINYKIGGKLLRAPGQTKDPAAYLAHALAIDSLIKDLEVEFKLELK